MVHSLIKGTATNSSGLQTAAFTEMARNDDSIASGPFFPFAWLSMNSLVLVYKTILEAP
jgi:hypothetical protein